MKKYLYFIAVGWAILMFGACGQTDPVNPDSTVIPRLASIENTLGQTFILTMNVGGNATVDVLGEGVSERISIFTVRTDFSFDPETYESQGLMNVNLENGYSYAFEMNGQCKVDGDIETSSGISFHLGLIYTTDPDLTDFDGFLYMENPDCLTTSQDGIVRRNAYINRYDLVSPHGDHVD